MADNREPNLEPRHDATPRALGRLPAWAAERTLAVRREAEPWALLGEPPTADEDSGAARMLPTHRQSHGRTRRRRSHDALVGVRPTICPLSGTPKQHHRACKQSGYVRPGLRIRVPKLGIGEES